MRSRPYLSSLLFLYLSTFLADLGFCFIGEMELPWEVKGLKSAETDLLGLELGRVDYVN